MQHVDIVKNLDVICPEWKIYNVDGDTPFNDWLDSTVDIWGETRREAIGDAFNNGDIGIVAQIFKEGITFVKNINGVFSSSFRNELQADIDKWLEGVLIN